jgi:hypothetical protein
MIQHRRGLFRARNIFSWLSCEIIRFTMAKRLFYLLMTFPRLNNYESKILIISSLPEKWLLLVKAP